MWRSTVNFSISQVQTAYHLKCFSAARVDITWNLARLPPISTAARIYRTLSLRQPLLLTPPSAPFSSSNCHFGFFIINLSIFGFSSSICPSSPFSSSIILDLGRQLQFPANSGPVTDCTKFVKPQTGRQKSFNLSSKNWTKSSVKISIYQQEKMILQTIYTYIF